MIAEGKKLVRANAVIGYRRVHNIRNRETVISLSGTSVPPFDSNRNTVTARFSGTWRPHDFNNHHFGFPGVNSHLIVLEAC